MKGTSKIILFLLTTLYSCHQLDRDKCITIFNDKLQICVPEKLVFQTSDVILTDVGESIQFYSADSTLNALIYYYNSAKDDFSSWNNLCDNRYRQHPELICQSLRLNLKNEDYAAILYDIPALNIQGIDVYTWIREKEIHFIIKDSDTKSDDSIQLMTEQILNSMH